jgi:hypothetical protein
MKELPHRSVFFSLRNVHTEGYGPFGFLEDTVMGTSYLEMLQIWFFPRLQKDEPEDSVMQQNGAPPHFHLDVRRWLNDILPHQWMGGVLDVLSVACTVP